MQNGIGEEAATNFQDVFSTRMGGISGRTYQGSEYMNLLNHRVHIWTLNFTLRPPRV